MPRPAPSPPATKPTTKIRSAPAGTLARIFGTAPGAYGAGIDGLTDAGRRSARPIWPPPRTAMAAPTATAGRRPAPSPPASPSADLLVHVSDDPARDLLEGAEDAAHVGGFAAAAAALGSNPDLVMLDMTDPRRPRARPLSNALARIVRARAINPRFIEGQMRHGPRGAAELAETVDRLIDFATTTARGAERADRSRARRLSGRSEGARFPDAGKSRRRARHRRAARRRAAARPLASAAKRHRRRASPLVRAEAAE